MKQPLYLDPIRLLGESWLGNRWMGFFKSHAKRLTDKERDVDKYTCLLFLEPQAQLEQ